MYSGGIRKQTAKNTGTSLYSIDPDHCFKDEGNREKSRAIHRSVHKLIIT